MSGNLHLIGRRIDTSHFGASTSHRLHLIVTRYQIVDSAQDISQVDAPTSHVGMQTYRPCFRHLRNYSWYWKNIVKPVTYYSRPSSTFRYMRWYLWVGVKSQAEIYCLGQRCLTYAYDRPGDTGKKPQFCFACLSAPVETSPRLMVIRNRRSWEWSMPASGPH